MEMIAHPMSKPDETRTPDKTVVEVNKHGDYTVGRFTFQPGWTWDSCVKPGAGTDHCEKTHVGYCISGQLEVWTPGGEKMTINSGDSYAIPPTHDAKVVGSAPFVGIEFVSADSYAK
jgi:quercetin dioxygenase-like cupin family protein